jgi:hypothetical protein
MTGTVTIIEMENLATEDVDTNVILNDVLETFNVAEDDVNIYVSYTATGTIQLDSTTNATKVKISSYFILYFLFLKKKVQKHINFGKIR